MECFGETSNVLRIRSVPWENDMLVRSVGPYLPSSQYVSDCLCWFSNKNWGWVGANKRQTKKGTPQTTPESVKQKNNTGAVRAACLLRLRGLP